MELGRSSRPCICRRTTNAKRAVLNGTHSAWGLVLTCVFECAAGGFAGSTRWGVDGASSRLGSVFCGRALVETLAGISGTRYYALEYSGTSTSLTAALGSPRLITGLRPVILGPCRWQGATYHGGRGALGEPQAPKAEAPRSHHHPLQPSRTN